MHLPLAPRLALAVTVVVSAACGGGDDVTSDAERFCGEAIENRDAIVSPPLGTEAELEATLDFYRLMGQLAPVGISEEWNALVINLETASELTPGDPESEQRVALQAYATEPAAFRVAKWLDDNCGLELPIVTIAPQQAVPAQTTTVPPSSTTPTSVEGG